MEVIVPARNGIDRESFHFKGSMQTLYECIEWTQRDGIVVLLQRKALNYALVVRSGFVRWYNEATEEQRIAGTRNGSAWAGVEGSKESVEWIGSSFSSRRW
jgi:hypothetical protein